MILVKHEVWVCKDGLSGLFYSGERGGNELHPEDGAALIFSFYADSYFDAMTKYYECMNWGKYETEFEIDKKPYDLGELEALLQRSVIAKNS